MRGITKIPLELFSEWLKSRLQQELRDQGHVATGQLLRSIDFDIQIKGGTISIYFYYLDYGVDLDTGVPASKIPKSGAAVTARIKSLENWVRVKGIERGKLAGKVAYFIHKTHEVTGVPSPGSFKFSRNGRRTGWVRHTLKDYRQEIESRSETALQAVAAKLLIEVCLSVASSNQYVYVS